MINKNIFIYALLGISITLATASGCRIIKPIADFIFLPANTTNKEPNAESPARQLLNSAKKANWVNALAIPIIALGAVSIFNGAFKLGMSAIIFGVVNLFMALATARFAFIMALFGLVGSVLAVVASILIKNKALKEIITNVQDIKKAAKDDNVDPCFQDKIKETLGNQVNSTKKLVSEIKAEVKSALNKKET